jgi:hypothetical protein
VSARFAAENPTKAELPGPQYMDALVDWLDPRIPPANVQYPLDEDVRWYFKQIVAADRARKHRAHVVTSAVNHLARDKRAQEAYDAMLETEGLGGFRARMEQEAEEFDDEDV